MKFEYFIAKKIIKKRKGSDAPDKKNTNPIIGISTISIALGLAVMILAVSIVTGFQNEIRQKVIGFGSHIQITSLEQGNSTEMAPISSNQDFYPGLDTIEGIRHIQVFATKAGIIKSKDQVEGIILKGISGDYDWEFFNKNLIEGKGFSHQDSVKNDSVVISKSIADRLKLKVGDSFRMYFIQQPVRQRRFRVAGIYKTDLELLDKVIVLADIRHIQKLNDWDENVISGFEVLIDRFDDLDNMDEKIYRHIPYDLSTVKITDKNHEIFGWLDLMDINVIVILFFSVLVAGINMISALLILILEKTNLIGMLKALGATDFSIRNIFLINAGYLILKGLFWGNFIGLSLAFIQLKFGLITLPEESYYISQVPINIDLGYILILNLGTFILTITMLIIPAMAIGKISPVKAIRFN